MIVCRPELAPRIDKAVFPFLQGGPLMHAVAAKAVALRGVRCSRRTRTTPARSSPTPRRSPTALAAEGMRPVSGGTDTHLALLDLQRRSGSPAREAEARCDAAGITLNKNAIPYDPQPPMVASGIRVGTPAVTTQGMTEGDMKEVAALIGRAVRDADGVVGGRDRRGGRPRWSAQHPAYPRPGLAGPTPRARVPAHPGGRRRRHLPADPGRAPARAALGRDDRGPRPGRARHPDAAAGRGRDAGRLRRRLLVATQLPFLGPRLQRRPADGGRCSPAPC